MVDFRARDGKGSWPLILGFCCIAHSFSHMFVLMFATVVLVLEREFNMPFADLAWLSLPCFVLFGLGAIPAGWLGDRWSMPGMMAVFFIGLGGASIFTGMADGPTELMTGLAMIGLFASIYHPVGIAWLVKNATNRGRALGINGVFGSLGTAAAAAVAGGIGYLLGWRAVFLLPGAVSIMLGVIFALVVGNGRLVDASHDQQPAAEAGAVDIRRAFVALALAVLCTGLIYQSTSVGLPKLLSERVPDFLNGELDRNVLGAGALVSGIYLISALSQMLGGELAHRYPIKPVYLAFQILQIPVFLLAIIAQDWSLIVVAAIMVSLNVAGQPAENVLLAQYTPLRWRGRVFGAKFLLTLGISAVGVSLVPLIHAATGSLDGLFYALIIFAIGGSAAAMALPRSAIALPESATAVPPGATTRSGSPAE